VRKFVFIALALAATVGLVVLLRPDAVPLMVSGKTKLQTTDPDRYKTSGGMQMRPRWDEDFDQESDAPGE